MLHRVAGLRRQLAIGAVVLTMLGSMSLTAPPTHAAREEGFAFDVRRFGWSTYNRQYVATGGPVSVKFTQAPHDVTVKLTDCKTGAQLPHTAEVRFPAPAENRGWLTIGRAAPNQCFKLTMKSSSFHVVRVIGLISH